MSKKKLVCGNCDAELKRTTPNMVGYNIADYYCPICGLVFDSEGKEVEL